jgi:hypothetical protein
MTLWLYYKIVFYFKKHRAVCPALLLLFYNGAQVITSVTFAEVFLKLDFQWRALYNVWTFHFPHTPGLSATVRA